jgi:hypothetical protein
MASKKFPKELLESILDEDAPGYEIVADQFVEKSRWLLHYELIFREPGQLETAWSVGYVKGATEMQDCSPFEYESDEVACSLVKPVEQTTIIWVEIDE